MGCASPLPHEAWKLGQRPLYCIPPGVDPERALRPYLIDFMFHGFPSENCDTGGG